MIRIAAWALDLTETTLTRLVQLGVDAADGVPLPTDDRGVFVMLDRAMPSRLLGAFPEGVSVERLGLKDAITQTRAFLSQHD